MYGSTPTLDFTGEYTDGATSLVNLRARQYNPQTGLFLTRDPVAGTASRVMSRNGYSYAEGNPVNYTDPSGKFLPILGGLIFGAAVGGLASMAAAAAVYDQAAAGHCGCDLQNWAKHNDRGQVLLRAALSGVAMGAAFTALALIPGGEIMAAGAGVGMGLGEAAQGFMDALQHGANPCNLLQVAGGLLGAMMGISGIGGEFGDGAASNLAADSNVGKDDLGAGLPDELTSNLEQKFAEGGQTPDMQSAISSATGDDAYLGVRARDPYAAEFDKIGVPSKQAGDITLPNGELPGGLRRIYRPYTEAQGQQIWDAIHNNTLDQHTLDPSRIHLVVSDEDMQFGITKSGSLIYQRQLYNAPGSIGRTANGNYRAMGYGNNLFNHGDIISGILGEVPGAFHKDYLSEPTYLYDENGPVAQGTGWQILQRYLKPDEYNNIVSKLAEHGKYPPGN